MARRLQRDDARVPGRLQTAGLAQQTQASPCEVHVRINGSVRLVRCRMAGLKKRDVLKPSSRLPSETAAFSTCPTGKSGTASIRSPIRTRAVVIVDFEFRAAVAPIEFLTGRMRG